jgi:hypothetical protein
MTLDAFLIDKRVVERHITSGKVDAALYQKQLEALPDLSSQVARRPDDATPAASTSDAMRASVPRGEASELSL